MFVSHWSNFYLLSYCLFSVVFGRRKLVLKTCSRLSPALVRYCRRFFDAVLALRRSNTDDAIVGPEPEVVGQPLVMLPRGGVGQLQSSLAADRREVTVELSVSAAVTSSRPTVTSLMLLLLLLLPLTTQPPGAGRICQSLNTG